jgi:hypothetical protein
LLAHVRRFSPDTPASSTTKTGRYDIAEILLKAALNIQKKSINQSSSIYVLNIICNLPIEISVFDPRF